MSAPVGMEVLMDNTNLHVNTVQYYDFDPREGATEDVPFYLEYAKKLNGDILELGCGTGRVTIPLATAGHNVTGLELSMPMIEKLNKKNKSGILLEIKQEDMSNFRLNKTYKLIIIPFRAFQALTTYELAHSCLLSVKEHLKSGGFFIFNVFSPRYQYDENWVYPQRVQWQTKDPVSGDLIIKLEEGYNIDTEEQVIYFRQTYKIMNNNKVINERTDAFAYKYYYYRQIEKMLIDTGFNILNVYDWYDKTPYDKSSFGGREMIFECSI